MLPMFSGPSWAALPAASSYRGAGEPSSIICVRTRTRRFKSGFKFAPCGQSQGTEQSNSHEEQAGGFGHCGGSLAAAADEEQAAATGLDGLDADAFKGNDGGQIHGAR